MTVTYIDTDALRDRTLNARIDSYLLSLGLGVNPYLERRRGFAEVRRLDRLSDAELRRLGLTRGDIVPHVFGNSIGH